VKALSCRKFQTQNPSQQQTQGGDCLPPPFIVFCHGSLKLAQPSPWHVKYLQRRFYAREDSSRPMHSIALESGGHLDVKHEIQRPDLIKIISYASTSADQICGLHASASGVQGPVSVPPPPPANPSPVFFEVHSKVEQPPKGT
jgi:hypothetical protein